MQDKAMAQFVYSQLYIDGQWVAAREGASYGVINPATEEEIGRAPDASVDDMDHAIAAARRAFDSGPWTRMSPADLAQSIRRIADALHKRRARLLEILVAEAGAAGFLAAAQLDTPIAALHEYADAARNFEFEQMLPVKTLQ